ncbi:GDYXXLXY domain-containing protein [Geobacillus stearothermophilus]|uniref:GDYXXLXY domain-containing protein n=1 Tax=Geobacillus stearothermophilus TaxID=1422 RepID=UPI003D226F51
MAARVVKTGYALAFLCMIAGMVYFFAANWPEMGREVKVGISIGMMAVFYIASAALWGRRRFLGRWMLISGVLSLGIALALVGQMYNSHADSYWLFLVWLAPTALLALLTKERALSVIALVLLQLACWFYYFPSAYRIEWTEWSSFGVLSLFVIVNGALVVFARTPLIRCFAYLAMQGWLLVMDITGFSYGRDAWWPYVYAVLLAVLLYYFLVIAKQRLYVLLTSLFAGLFLFIQYIRLLADHYGTWLLLIGLVAAAAVLYGGVVLLRRTGLFSAKTKAGKWFLAAFQAIVTLAASALAIQSLLGLYFLWTESWSPYVLFFISIFGFVVPASFGRRWNAVVRYTLLAVGYGLGVAMAGEVSRLALFLYAIGLAIGIIRSSDSGVRRLTTAALTVYFGIALSSAMDDGRTVLLTLALVNGGLYAYGRFRGTPFLTPLVLAFGALGIATSADVFAADGLYVALNIVMVLALAFFLFRGRQLERKTAWVYTALYLVLKYYEFAWNLLHKSISLLAAGVALLAWTLWLEKRNGFTWAKGVRWGRRVSLWTLIVVIAQFSFLGYTVWQKERLLRYGDVVKLELEPVDPRSMLQGDYIRLRYDISTIPSLEGSGRVQVGLRKGADGVHRLAGVYMVNGNKRPGYTPQPGDVIITGTFHGPQVVYGIESYFIPEKTGMARQENVRFAYVRVSESGDALLEAIRAE